MPSIATAAKAANALRQARVTIVRERCVRYRHKASTCEFCRAVCPFSSVSFDSSNAPMLDEESCTGCGACSSVCPTGALECANPDGARLQGDVSLAIEMSGGVTFACEWAGDAPGAIRVPCLARIDVSLALHALSSGAGCVRLVSGMCESCPSQAAGLVGRAMAETAALIAECLGHEGAVIMTAAETAGQEEAARGSALSRRAFFLMLSSKGAEAGEKAALALIQCAEETAPRDPRILRGGFTKHVPVSRIRLTSALRALALGDEAALEGFLFSVPAIDEARCRGCAMCATCCPTGALEASREGEHFTLTFDARTCTSCYLCEDVCGKSAITRSEGVVSSLLAAGPLPVVRTECKDPYSVRHDEKLARLFSAPMRTA